MKKKLKVMMKFLMRNRKMQLKEIVVIAMTQTRNQVEQPLVLI